MWVICAILAIVAFFFLFLWHLISNKFEFHNFYYCFFNLFRFFITIMTILYLLQGIYYLNRLFRKDSKEFQLNFHESYILFYIFLSLDLFISSLITLLNIYYYVMKIFILKIKRKHINQEFIENIKDEINLKPHPFSSSIDLTSDEYIKNNKFIGDQINQIKYVISSPEYIKKIHHFKYDSNESNSKIKNQILNFAFGNDKKKDNLLQETKKNVDITSSQLKKSSLEDKNDIEITTQTNTK